MKVALVSFGHADSAIPLAKALSGKLEVELFFVFSLNLKKNNVINFEELDVNVGIQSPSTCQNAFSEEVRNYISNSFKLHLFIYKNHKLKSPTNWKLSLEFAKILKNYDLIHFNGKSLNIFQIRLFMLRKTTVYTIHDLENHSGERAKNILARKFNQLIIKSRKHVVIQNKSDYEHVKKLYQQRTDYLHFIPFGKLEIYKQYLLEKTDAPACDILFFGRISPYKGIEFLIEAGRHLKRDFPDIHTIIAGGGNFYFDISQAQEDPAFTIINRFMASNELVGLINNCKMVVCPYTDATQSGVAMTAFVFNKPVIATNTGGFADIISDGVNGFLVPPRDVEALYEKIKLMMSDAELLDQMGKNIQQQGETGEFAWPVIAEQYKKLYHTPLK